MSVTAGSSGSVRVVVYDSRIQAMSAPGGDVYRYAQGKARTTAALAEVEAPKRSGRRAASFRTDPRTVRNGAVARVRANAHYAVYVHEGTTGPITGHSGRLWVPVAPRSAKRRWMDSVSGQSANPFLARALSASMRAPSSMFGPRLTSNPF